MPDLAELLAEYLPLLPTLQQVVFFPIAGFVAIAALLTVFANNLFHSALGLIATLFGVAGLFVLLEAEFIAVSQVLVYVGTISTLITFAIMLTRGMIWPYRGAKPPMAGWTAGCAALCPVGNGCCLQY